MNRTLQSRLLHGSLCPRLLHGEMAERFNAAVLKTAVGQPTVGSNPTLSAKLLLCRVQAMPVFTEQKKAGVYDGRPGIPGTALSALLILPPA